MYGECHGHIMMNGVNFQDALALHEGHISDTAIRKNFQTYIDKGIRFFRDGGDRLGVSKRAREIKDEYGIDYRTPIFATHKKGNYGRIVGVPFTDIKEFQSLVKELVKENADFVKVMSAGILNFDKYGEISEGVLTKDEIKQVAHISHEEGFSVMVHVNGRQAIYDTLSAGVESIEHGYFMDDECLALLKEKGTVWVPTMAPIANLLKDPLHRFNAESVKKIWSKQKENVKKAFDMGVNIALGSDAGAYMVPHADGLYDEYNLLKDAIPDTESLNTVLEKSENIIKSQFWRS